jgi:hypothetical protein
VAQAGGEIRPTRRERLLVRGLFQDAKVPFCQGSTVTRWPLTFGKHSPTNSLLGGWMSGPLRSQDSGSSLSSAR